MKAIVNATPLIALSLVGRLTLLQDLFDEVIVPATVYDEVVVQGRGRPGAELLSPQEAFEDLDRLLNAGIRVSPRWQNWFRSEVSKV